MHTSARSDAAVWDPVETGARERLGALPLEQVVRVHASSGSHGKPTVVGYTRADLEAWIEVMARCMTMAGVRPGMIVHNANGYGLFTGGLGFHYGGERIGATVIPVSGGFTARQAMLLRDLGGQVLCATPSYALVIAQAVRDAGLEPSDLALQIGLFGGEPWTEEMRTEVDRETGEPVPEGADGELVFTTLLKQAQPLIRYRTGDIGSITSEPCACGRTFARITALRGRLDDMLIIRGVNLFPSTVETLLLGVAEVAPHYRLIVERPAEMDEVTVECEPADSDIDRAELALRLETLLRDHTGIRIPVSVLEPGAVPRSEGKAVRVVDRRQAS